MFQNWTLSTLSAYIYSGSLIAKVLSLKKHKTVTNYTEIGYQMSMFVSLLFFQKRSLFCISAVVTGHTASKRESFDP